MKTPRSTPNDARYAAPALDKGLDVLEHLAAVGIPQTQTEIAAAIGRSQAELFRMLARLEARGYILRDRASPKYELSLKLYHLSHLHSPVDSLRRAAMQPLQELAEEVGHPAHLCVLDRDRLLVVMQVRSPNPVSLSIEEGSRFPIESTTSGKLLLACLPEEDRQLLLKRSPVFGRWSKALQRDFLASLAPLRAHRHLAAPSELTHGVTDIAALIGTVGGPFIGTVAVSCVSTLLGRTAEPAALVRATQAAAQAINRASGIGL